MTAGEAVVVDAPSASAMRAAGARLAAVLRAGDVVLLAGDLGAGKTTLTQGIAAGLGVTGPVTSPTFVIAREHAATAGRPALVHADAYRLSSVTELDALDLDTALAEAVTVIEWGAGLAEGLSGDRLEVTITRGRGNEPAGDESRELRIVAVGERWAGVMLAAVVAAG